MARRGARRAAEAGDRTRVAGCWHAPSAHCAGWGRRAPYLGEPRASGGRRPEHSPASGHTQPPGARSPSRARTPGLAPSRHPGRAQPRAHSPWQVRPGPGAHTQRGAPTAAAAGLAGRRRQPELRPSSPAASTTGVPAFAGGKKKSPDAARALVCRKGQHCEPEGRVLALINSEALWTELLEKLFEKRPPTPNLRRVPLRFPRCFHLRSSQLLFAPDSEWGVPSLTAWVGRGHHSRS